jgi:hypothetical protein
MEGGCWWRGLRRGWSSLHTLGPLSINLDRNPNLFSDRQLPLVFFTQTGQGRAEEDSKAFERLTQLTLAGKADERGCRKR